MNGKLHALAALPPGENPHYPSNRRLSEPQNRSRLLTFTGILTVDRPSRNQLRYSGSHTFIYQKTWYSYVFRLTARHRQAVSNYIVWWICIMNFRVTENEDWAHLVTSKAWCINRETRDMVYNTYWTAFLVNKPYNNRSESETRSALQQGNPNTS
jgi:hypothetical protein